MRGSGFAPALTAFVQININLQNNYYLYRVHKTLQQFTIKRRSASTSTVAWARQCVDSKWQHHYVQQEEQESESTYVFYFCAD